MKAKTHLAHNLMNRSKEVNQRNYIIAQKNFRNNNPNNKTMLNKIYIFILAFMFTMTGLYAQDPEVEIHDIEAGAGEIIVPVDMNNFTQEVNSFTFNINLDEDLLSYDPDEIITNVEDTIKGQIHAGNPAGSPPSHLRITWNNTEGFLSDGHVFDLKFDFTGTATTTLSFMEGQNEITHAIFPIENVTYTDGTITSTEQMPDPVVNIQDVTADPGAVNVPVEMNYFEDAVNAFEYHIEFENELLQFVQLDNVAAELQGGIQVNNPSGNELIIAWNGQGVDFNPSGQIFDLVFNYTGGFNTDLLWGTGNEVISGVTPVEDVGFVQGSVTQTTPPDGTVSLPNQEVMSGDQFMVPLNFSGDGLDNVAAFTTHFSYDPNELNFQGIDSPLVEPINVNEPSSGEVTLIWQGTAQDFTDADVVNLVFIYTGVNETTIEFQPGSEVNDELAAPLAVEYVNGLITPQAAQDTISVNNVTAFPGQTVTVPISSTEIGDVGAMDLLLEYDADKLTFTGEWDANQLSGWEFNQTGNQLTFGTYAPGTINSGSIIDLTFVYDGGGEAPINFLSGSEVTGPLGTPIPTNFLAGSVTQATSDSQAEIASVTNCDQNIATVPVTLTEVDPVSGFDLEIGFNATALNFVELQNVNPAITGYNINTDDQTISLNWNTTAGAIDLNGVLFELVFDYLGSYSEITFNSGSQFFNEIGESLPIQFIDGEVDCNLDQRTLTVDVDGGGSAQVSEAGTILDPDEGTDNEYTVLWGTTLTLEGFSDEGWQFESWSGAVDDNAANPTTITMNNDYGVTLNMDMIEYALNLTPIPAEGGTTSYIDADGDEELNFEDEVTIVADSSEGWKFVSWTKTDGTLVTENSEYNFSMPSNDTAFNANYERKSYDVALAVSPEGEGAGTVEGAGTYLYEEEVTVTATPSEGWSFVNWTNVDGDVVSESLSETFNMPASDTSLTANFEMIDYTVSLEAQPEEGGTLTGGGTYNFEDDVTVEAIANEGWAFINWTNAAGDTVSTDAAYNFSMPSGDLTLTANFEMIDYTVSLSAQPEEGGMVTGQGVYNFEDEVTIDAAANDAWVFTHWSTMEGDTVSTDASYTFNMPSENVSYVANFELNEFDVNLTADPEEGGTVAGGGTYIVGESVTVYAIENDDWEFINWTDANGVVVSDDATYTFDMPANEVNLTANFQEVIFTLDLVAEPQEGGVVTGGGDYMQGSSIAVEATTNEGWSFINWTNESGDVVSEEASFSYTMPSDDVTLTANFEMDEYNVTVEADPNEGGTVSGGGTYNFEDDVTVTATANDGYEFVNWTNSLGTVVSEDPTYNFNMPSNSVSLTANFEPIEYTLTLNADPSDGGTVEGGGQYFAGTNVEIAATTNEGWSFINWTNEDGDIVSTSPTYNVTMPLGDLELTANFEINEYSVSLEPNPLAGGSVSGEGTFSFGDEVTVVAETNNGYYFANWTNQAGDVVSSDASYTFDMPSNDVDLTANFEPNEYELSLDVQPEEGGSVTGGGTFTYASTVTIEATPNAEDGWFFLKWTDGDGNTISENQEYTFSMPFTDVTYIAHFDFNTGIEELSSKDISIYPNPADDKVSIRVDQESSSMIEEALIYNSVGNQVRIIGKDKISENFEINISDLEPGLYYLQFRTDEGMLSKKVIVL